MKTTFDLPEPLLLKAKSIAAKNNTTLRALVETGLRKVIESEQLTAKPFKLRTASVKGHGLQPNMQGLTMAQLIELSYERGSN